MLCRSERVIPASVEGMKSEWQCLHLLIRDLELGWVLTLIKGGLKAQSLGRCRSADELHDYVVADQRPPTPVHADVREHAVFDLVPLAGTRRQVADRYGEPRIRGQFGQRVLPEANTRSIAATAVGTDKQTVGVRVCRLADGVPPASNAFDCECCGVVIYWSFEIGG